ncbi:MAG: isoaspartyl peptidase/L-asparaginase [Algibacter sp.]|uniref:isoaspartyl peptidase/L-asparaginase family protein n=1 Tax=Algibacter sp. TaxID=1872428 RepID=UPI002627B7FB|nr:isoaspartyl peptidase/L-asparaginase [Algibacter sp.]MDG1730775.1 isoaspartyl peptidase/L-asparaginase [Algibacter sp.]MDG2177352.1 isoaspartyl peptidase/L-asparaginase [Algibacter sp.]
MKKCIYLIFALLIFSACKNESKKPSEAIQNETEKVEFSIIIHGGAGSIRRDNMSEEREAEYRQKLEEAIRVGYTILKEGGTSLDAVQNTINILEDSPLFNAGKGAVFTHEGFNEHDASIMDGKTLNAGASAGTKTIKNPINLARAVMDNSPHVFLSRGGAETFAKEQGLEIVEPNYFSTTKKLKSLERVKASEKNKVASFYDADLQDSKFGTVGCAALDKHGNLAAGTSTGGMTNKRWGRIGDSPIIGAGTYANNNTCAVSSTGWGEFFIRGMVAYDISALMEYKGLSLKEAAKEVIQNKLPNIGDQGATGGIVAIDKDGNMVMEFNTQGMFRAIMNAKGELYIGMFKD